MAALMAVFWAWVSNPNLTQKLKKMEKANAV